MVSKSYGSSVYGVNASIITVEVNVGHGLKFWMAGLSDMAVKESAQRIDAAITSSGYEMPRQNVVVNLAPAEVKKNGSPFDFPIAIGILKSSGQIEGKTIEEFIIIGELALDGILKPIKGVLPIAIEARKQGFKGIILPKTNAPEAAIVNNLRVIGVKSLQEAVDYLEGELEIKPTVKDTRDIFYSQLNDFDSDFSDVEGQENIKRVLEIAAAGGHNVIMVGPPGAEKTMLAKRLPSILPPLTLIEALETTKIHSLAGKLSHNTSLISSRPYRAPHHTIGEESLTGGGDVPQPGEVSLAHNGILFLDELPEFKRSVLEVMRQALEESAVTISIAELSVDFPANFMLLASMNPCPCGHYNHPEKECVCPPGVVQSYFNKVRGPLLDQIDLHVEVITDPFEAMKSNRKTESSEEIRKRVVKAREKQTDRFEGNKKVFSNAMMSAQMVNHNCKINKAGKTLLKIAMEKLRLSARAYDKILKVSRTIADLADSEEIKIEHLAEAIQYRSLDRE